MLQRCSRIPPYLLVALALSGCATSRLEPPPEIAPQPPAITTAEAVQNGEAAAAEAREEAAAAGAPVAPSAAPAPAATQVVTTTGPARAQRSRPTARSVQEIREQNANEAFPLDFQQRLDHAHDRLYTWVQRRVERMDYAMADDDKPLKPVPAAPFRLGAEMEAIDRSGGVKLDLNLDLDIALRLPNTEERLRIFITSDELDGSRRESGRDSSLRAGLRYTLLRDLDFDLGLRIDTAPVAFAAVRWTRQFALGDWDFYPLAKVFIETKESFGYATGATFDRWSGRQLLRSSTYAKWRHDRNRTEWSQTFIYAHAHELLVPDRYGSYPRADDIGRGWGVRAEVSGKDTHQVSRYETGLFYRRPTRSAWIYWHVEPFVQWDRDYRWSTDPGVRIGIDALFWDLARPARAAR